ncbi:MAG: putative sensor domain DACNV-containing protein [Bryobacteraceae bacterium]
MTQPTYAAAQRAADRIHDYFRRNPLAPSECLATLPDPATLASLIDTAFWTSLRREETFTPRITLAYAGPHQVSKPISFATPLPLIPTDLTKMAAAVERAGIHLCVWRVDDELQVWGIARTIPQSCIVIETLQPGLLVVKQSPPNDAGKYRNIAVLQGDSIKIIDPNIESAPRFRAPTNEVNALLQLAVSMRHHGRGGMLLLVPDTSEHWRESIATPIKYEITPAFHGFSSLLKKDESGRATRTWEDAMARAVDAIAGLTAVDGATILNTQYDLLAFGAKIVRRKGAPQVPEVTISESVEDGHPTTVDPTELGGTRHFSAAQFTHDQHDALALVASQDGRFTVFGWSEKDAKVHAHRIDALLL